MEEIEILIEKEKRRYIEFARKNQTKHIYIYGAGKQAIPIVEYLERNNIKIDGFCVSDVSSNKKTIKNYPVIQINQICFSADEVAIIFGVRVQLNDEIKKTIEKYGYTNYLVASDLVRYLGEYGYYFYTNPMLEITTKLGCEVNCKYCPQEKYVKQYIKTGNGETVLSYSNFVKIIDKLPQNMIIEFAGFTEPFLNRDCLDMIKYAKKKGHKVNLFTTIRGLSYEQAKELIQIDFEEFVLHVPDEEGYSIIPIDDEYKKIIKLLINSQKNNGEDYVDYACSQGTVPSEIKRILGENTRIYVVLNDRAGNLEDENLYGKKGLKGSLRCELSIDINHNVLLPDGRVVLCSNDWGLKHVLGNLLNQSYEEVMHGDKANKIRKALLVDDGEFLLCRNCFQAIER